LKVASKKMLGTTEVMQVASIWVKETTKGDESSK
jgi:hypothetical protein